MTRRVLAVAGAVLVGAIVAVVHGFLAPPLVLAHGGGLDSRGCHHDRKNGGYHCHRGPLAGQAFGSAPDAIAAMQRATSPPSPVVQTALAQGAGRSQAAQNVNLVALMGKTRAQITNVFPGKANPVEKWNGWKIVYLGFNAKGRLVSVNLEPLSPLTEAQAEEAVRRFGVMVDKRKYVVGPAVHHYSNMTGPIRTVNYMIESGKVKDIGIFSSIGYNE